MTEQQAKIICEHHGIIFANRSYGLCSTKTITLMCLHQVINDAIKWEKEQAVKLAKATFDDVGFKD